MAKTNMKAQRTYTVIIQFAVNLLFTCKFVNLYFFKPHIRSLEDILHGVGVEMVLRLLVILVYCLSSFSFSCETKCGSNL